MELIWELDYWYTGVRSQIYFILFSVKQGWSKNNGNNNYGPFASSSKEKQWVGYDDVRSVARKADYIQSQV